MELGTPHVSSPEGRGDGHVWDPRFFRSGRDSSTLRDLAMPQLTRGAAGSKIPDMARGSWVFSTLVCPFFDAPLLGSGFKGKPKMKTTI